MSLSKKDQRGTLDMWRSLLPNTLPPEAMFKDLPDLLEVTRAVYNSTPASMPICAAAVLGSINAAVEGRYVLGYPEARDLSPNHFHRLGINFAVGDRSGFGKSSARDVARGSVVPSRQMHLYEMNDYPGDWHAAIEFQTGEHPSRFATRGVPILLTIDDDFHLGRQAQADKDVLARHHERLETIIGSNQPSGLHIVRMRQHSKAQYDMRSLTMRLGATLAIYSDPNNDKFAEHYAIIAKRIVKSMLPKFAAPKAAIRMVPTTIAA